MWSITFFINTTLLGVGLAMDAFSVSLANGFNDHKMKITKVLGIAFIFGLFQGIMPLIGWICVHTIVEKFIYFKKFIPWIALIILSYIGGKMIFDFFAPKKENDDNHKITFWLVFIQGLATSIDALSVGFTISNYELGQALLCVSIIMVITFLICLMGIIIGKKFGTKLANKASLIGGIILVAIGIEIFILGV